MWPSSRTFISPEKTKYGLPLTSLRISASCQLKSDLAFSALASASFAAKRAASDEIFSLLSFSVKTRASKPGVRSSDSLNLSISTTSIPIPVMAASRKAAYLMG